MDVCGLVQIGRDPIQDNISREENAEEIRQDRSFIPFFDPTPRPAYGDAISHLERSHERFTFLFSKQLFFYIFTFVRSSSMKHLMRNLSREISSCFVLSLKQLTDKKTSSYLRV